MKNALALAITTALLSATSAFAQTAPTLPTEVYVQDGVNMQMGITESFLEGTGGAFAAGMQSGDLNGVMHVGSDVYKTTVDNTETVFDVEGNVLTAETELQNTTGANGTVSFGENIESVNDIDGSEDVVEGSIDL